MRLKLSKTKIIPYIILVLVVVFSVGGIFFTFSIWKSTQEDNEDHAKIVSHSIIEGLPSSNLTDIKSNSLEYSELRDYLNSIVIRNKDVKVIYIYYLHDGIINNYITSNNSLRFNEQITENKDLLINALSFEEITFKNIDDQFGSWKSVLLTVSDQDNFLLRVDYNLKDWNSHSTNRAIQVLAVFLLIDLLLIFNLIFFHKNIELKKEKKKLQTNEAIFRSLFHGAPLGVAYIDSKYRIASANSIFIKTLKRTKEEIERNWQNYIHPLDFHKKGGYFKKWLHGAVKGFSDKVRYIQKDDSITWINIIVAPLNTEYASFILIIDDVTKETEVNERLQEVVRRNELLFTNLPGLVYQCQYDHDWTMNFVSTGCYDLTGYDPESLLNNKIISYNDIIDPSYHEILWNLWTETIEKKDTFRAEYPIITSSGKNKWVYEQGRPVYDEEGNVISLEGLIIDITSRKQKEDEINYLNYHDQLTGLFNRRYFENIISSFDKIDKLPISILIGDIDGLKLINDSLGHVKGDQQLYICANILKSIVRENDILARTGGDEFKIIMPNTSKQEADTIIEKIKSLFKQELSKNSEFLANLTVGCATKTNLNQTFDSILKKAEDNMYTNKLLQSNSTHSSIITSMTMSLHEKSHETEEHSKRLIELSSKVADVLNLNSDQINNLMLLATLHDIGKIGISDSVLNKKGPLNEIEWEEMKKHPSIGYRIAMSLPPLIPVAKYILSHHERWDGNGYPNGISGEDIPLLSRIISIVDAYDAMTEDRPYRKALSKEAAIKELKNNAGTQFDPKLVKIFLDVIGDK